RHRDHGEGPELRRRRLRLGPRGPRRFREAHRRQEDRQAPRRAFHRRAGRDPGAAVHPDDGVRPRRPRGRRQAALDPPGPAGGHRERAAGPRVRLSLRQPRAGTRPAEPRPQRGPRDLPESLAPHAPRKSHRSPAALRPAGFFRGFRSLRPPYRSSESGAHQDRGYSFFSRTSKTPNLVGFAKYPPSWRLYLPAIFTNNRNLGAAPDKFEKRGSTKNAPKRRPPESHVNRVFRGSAPFRASGPFVPRYRRYGHSEAIP